MRLYFTLCLLLVSMFGNSQLGDINGLEIRHSNGANIIKLTADGNYTFGKLDISRRIGDEWVSVGRIDLSDKTNYYYFVDTDYKLYHLNEYMVTGYNDSGNVGCIGELELYNGEGMGKLVNVVNTMGLPVSYNSGGFKIVVYSDGTREKKIK